MYYLTVQAVIIYSNAVLFSINALSATVYCSSAVHSVVTYYITLHNAVMYYKYHTT